MEEGWNSRAQGGGARAASEVGSTRGRPPSLPPWPPWRHRHPRLPPPGLPRRATVHVRRRAVVDPLAVLRGANKRGVGPVPRASREPPPRRPIIPCRRDARSNDAAVSPPPTSWPIPAGVGLEGEVYLPDGTHPGPRSAPCSAPPHSGWLILPKLPSRAAHSRGGSLDPPCAAHFPPMGGRRAARSLASNNRAELPRPMFRDSGLS